MNRRLLLALTILDLTIAVVLAQTAHADNQTPTGTETGCDAPSGYPRDCETLPTGSGTFVAYVTPKGQIPTTFNGQTGYYQVRYWPYGCCSGTSSVLVRSSLKSLDNDGVMRGITFNDNGTGWWLRDGSTLCGGFWITSEARWLSIQRSNGACFAIHK